MKLVDNPYELCSYLHVSNPLLKSVDVAFIFGTPRPEPAHLAAKLFHGGKVSKILATGGAAHKTSTNQTESELHRDILLKLGVPDNCIFIENKSENTFENVLFGKEILDSRIPKVSTMVVICRWFHSRRVLMTIKKHMPSVVCYTETYDSFREDSGDVNWSQIEKAKEEFRKISIYLAKGDLVEIEPT